MDEKKDYYLLPNVTVNAEGLPKGGLKAPADKPLKVDKKYYPIFGASFDFLISKGKMATGEKIAADLVSEKENAAEKKALAAKIKAVNKEAKELEVEIPEGATVEAIEALIVAKKKELED